MSSFLTSDRLSRITTCRCWYDRQLAKSRFLRKISILIKTMVAQRALPFLFHSTSAYHYYSTLSILSNFEKITYSWPNTSCMGEWNLIHAFKHSRSSLQPLLRHGRFYGIIVWLQEMTTQADWTSALSLLIPPKVVKPTTSDHGRLPTK